MQKWKREGRMRILLLALWWILELYEPLKKRPLLFQACRVYLANSEAVQTTQETRDRNCLSVLRELLMGRGTLLKMWTYLDGHSGGPRMWHPFSFPWLLPQRFALLSFWNVCTLIQAFLFYMTYFSNGTERGNYKCMFKATRIFKFSLFLSCIFSTFYVRWKIKTCMHD